VGHWQHSRVRAGNLCLHFGGPVRPEGVPSKRDLDTLAASEEAQVEEGPPATSRIRCACCSRCPQHLPGAHRASGPTAQPEEEALLHAHV